MPDRKGRSADNATVERDESTVPEQPAAVQTTSGRGRGTKRPRRAASPEKGLSQAGEEKTLTAMINEGHLFSIHDIQ